MSLLSIRYCPVCERPVDTDRFNTCPYCDGVPKRKATPDLGSMPGVEARITAQPPPKPLSAPERASIHRRGRLGLVLIGAATLLVMATFRIQPGSLDLGPLAAIYAAIGLTLVAGLYFTLRSLAVRSTHRFLSKTAGGVVALFAFAMFIILSLRMGAILIG